MCCKFKSGTLHKAFKHVKFWGLILAPFVISQRVSKCLFQHTLLEKANHTKRQISFLYWIWWTFPIFVHLWISYILWMELTGSAGYFMWNEQGCSFPLVWNTDKSHHIFMWCRNSPATLPAPHPSLAWWDYAQAAVFAKHAVASFMKQLSKRPQHLGDPFHRIIIVTNPFKFSQIVCTFDRQISPTCFNFQTQWSEIQWSGSAVISVKL